MTKATRERLLADHDVQGAILAARFARETREMTTATKTRSLDAAERATVLAGLRALQHYLTHGVWPDPVRTRAIIDVATDGGTLTNLAPEDIDELCERLNAGREDGV